MEPMTLRLANPSMLAQYIYWGRGGGDRFYSLHVNFYQPLLHYPLCRGHPWALPLTAPILSTVHVEPLLTVCSISCRAYSSTCTFSTFTITPPPYVYNSPPLLQHSMSRGCGCDTLTTCGEEVKELCNVMFMQCNVTTHHPITWSPLSAITTPTPPPPPQVFHTNFQPLEFTVPHRPENVCYCKLICHKSDNVSIWLGHLVGSPGWVIWLGQLARSPGWVNWLRSPGWVNWLRSPGWVTWLGHLVGSTG